MSEREVHELAAELDARLNGVPVEQLLTSSIERDPYVPGAGDARLVRFGVPVWALVGHQAATKQPFEQVAIDYDLPVEAVLAAFAYYLRHRSAIDSRLEANAA